MSGFDGLAKTHSPDWEGLVSTVTRQAAPDRTYHIELFQDKEIRDAITERFDLTVGLSESDPWFEEKKYIAVQRFCGFDFVTAGVAMDMPINSTAVDDTAGLARDGGRFYTDEHSGPITSFEEFEKYPWPDPHAQEATKRLEWFQQNLPDDMCIIGGLTGHFCEYITWLMGYETLCFALHDERDLVRAITDKLIGMYRVDVARLLTYDRVKMIWGSDDMGYKTGTMISPDDLREFVFPGHRQLAQASHDAGRPYLLHCCGNMSEVIDDLVDDVKIDGKHSYEDTIEDVRELKHGYGQRMSLLGGIDVDFLCTRDEDAIRRRLRQTLDICQDGGGYCLGTGNTVANYVPLDNYLAMVDEGRLWGAS